MFNQLKQLNKGLLVVMSGPNVERLFLNRADPSPSLGNARAEPSTRHPFLTDLKVRQALSLAVDRRSVAQLYGPLGDPTCNIVVAPPALISTAAHFACGFDIARANALLGEAG